MTADPLGLNAAASLMPAWVRWGSVPAAMLMALLAAGAGGWIAARVALGRTRRFQAMAWPERRRRDRTRVPRRSR